MKKSETKELMKEKFNEVSEADFKPEKGGNGDVIIYGEGNDVTYFNFKNKPKLFDEGIDKILVYQNGEVFFDDISKTIPYETGYTIPPEIKKLSDKIKEKKLK